MDIVLPMSQAKEFDFESPRQTNSLPINDENRYLELLRLQNALRLSWNADTVAVWERDQWTQKLPAFGQCAVTALVVQDLFGGKLVKDPDNDHYWNVFDDGSECDLSREQFAFDIKLEAKLERTRDYMLTNERSIKAMTPDRYTILRERVRQTLGE